MADDADEYVVSGALLHCSQGTVPGLFTATPRTTKVMGMVVGTALDKAPLVNIPSFGICQKLTQAAGGTPVPCVPACAAWQKTYTASMGGAKPLLKMSCATCTAGQGKVEFMMSGQNPLSAAELGDLNEKRAEQEDTLRHEELEKQSVGEAGLLEGAIPVWGSGRDLIHSAQTGDKLGVVLNAGFLVWDVASVVAGAFSFGTATAGMKAGTHVAVGLARKEAATWIARSAALHAGFREGIVAARKLSVKLCVRACFAADTPVCTRSGPRPIAELAVGDEVWAWDEATGQRAWKAVLEVVRTEAAEVAELDFGGAAPLRLTPAHWLYAEPGGWTAAGDLSAGQRVRTGGAGEALTLHGTVIRIQTEQVYNLEVADFHTYYAGEGEVLAHNKCDALTELVDIGAGVFKKRLKPNTSYLRNGYEYATDAFGRIKKAAGELRLEPKATRLRDEYMQGKVGAKDGRKADDVGGHLIGDQFGGHGNNANVLAMDKLVNNYHKGTWGKMEKAWAQALRDGKKVKVDITPIYKDATARPSSFKVIEWIDGMKEVHTIDNF
jgi:DNA/RNA non-specific endonuclease/Pretoxin HINT domain/Domain of unknown function (DUF4280)